MRQLIRRILLEALGVPQGILESSEKLYDSILKKVKLLSNDDELSEEYKYQLKTNLNIVDLNIKKVFLEITFQVEDSLKGVEVYSMAVAQTSSFENTTLKIKAVISKGTIRMIINVAGPEGISGHDILKYFESKKSQLVSSLAHELGHAYNDFKKEYKSIKQVSRYAGITETSFPFQPIRNFLHYLYFIHEIENLVRPIEVSSMMRSGEIDREGFYDFLMNNRTYKMLKEINNFSYEGMREELKSDSEDIRKFLTNIGLENVDELDTDDKLVDELLRIVYINLSNNTITRIKKMMTVNFLEELLGFIGDKEKKFRDMINFFTRFENNPKGFYLYEEKNMKIVSSKMIKKLIKLWDLAKVNQSSIQNWDLHHKINKTGEQIETELKYKKR